MKKIISIFAVLFVSLTAFCLPTFALEPTEKTFSSFSMDSNNALFNHDTVSINYNSNDFPREITSATPWEFWYANSYHKDFSQMEFRWHTEDDFVNLDNGQIFQFELKNITTIGMSGFSTNNGNKPYVKVRYRIMYFDTGYDPWQVWEDFSYTRNSDGEFVIDLNFYYNNKNRDLRDIQFQIGIYNYGYTTADWVGIKFPEYAINVFNGSSNDPTAPSYSPPNELKDKTDTLKENEQILNESTEEGRDTTIGLFNSLGSAISFFTLGIRCISSIFNYFIIDTILESVLLVSLTLGLLAFVFNIGHSLVSRSNRDNNRNNKKGGS